MSDIVRARKSGWYGSIIQPCAIVSSGYSSQSMTILSYRSIAELPSIAAFASSNLSILKTDLPRPYSALPWSILGPATGRARKAAMLVSAANGAATSELRSALAALREAYLVFTTRTPRRLVRTTPPWMSTLEIISLHLTSRP
jgi:hypothetical protein